ncbi:MAG: DUF6110 family protein [Peptoniphilus sp.]|nr:DUF6110 family protein [Peptoniphilus sp.]MDY3118438.1 DUF6110 family protein [Peptoniphilus sp.]
MKKKLMSVGAGVLLGVIGEKIVKSNVVKNLAVSTVSDGLKIKEGIDHTIEKVKESAEDIVAEAKVKKEEDERAKREAEEAEETVEELAEAADDVAEAAE